MGGERSTSTPTRRQKLWYYGKKLWYYIENHGTLIYYEKKNYGTMFCWFVCLEFFCHLDNFSLIWRRHHCRWRAANCDLCPALMTIDGESSLAYHSYCDTGYHFIMVISRNIHTYCRAFGNGAVPTCFNDLGLSRLGFEHPTFRLRG